MKTSRRFNPHRRSNSPHLDALINTVSSGLETRPLKSGARQRKRRKAAEASVRATVEALLCDALFEHAIGDPNKQLSVYLTKNKAIAPVRYRYPFQRDNFGRIVKALADEQWLTLVKGGAAERDEETGKITRLVSTISAGPVSIAWLATNHLQVEDFKLEGSTECIVLKAARQPNGNKPAIDYADTEHTKSLRRDMEQVNVWLASLHITTRDPTVDVSDRYLRRVFNDGTFDHGGRLCGGFWQSMKAARRGAISLDGEPVVTLDYGQTFARILYGLEGAKPPQGDLYALPGMPPSARKGVKLTFNSLLFATSKPSRLPQGARSAGIPKRYGLVDVLTLLKAKHPAIAHHLPSNIGPQLYLIESEIMLEVLLRCRKQQLPALPIHDALLVPASKVHAARMIMETVFMERTGGTGAVGVTPAATSNLSLQ
ncbi:hypothetical protein U91I_02792 [alpha proteobacterium U9-1i]|nr:hypothetical protein U91I_02792 [alpha proteobacterium U9-1i]